MILPAERELRAVLARFAQTRIDHDVCPTGRTSQALDDVTYTLCVMTGARTAEQALRAADALLERYSTDREGGTQADETLAA
ncbi:MULTISPECIES: DUF5133 domain-containing protein [unclassified Streptomyces]|uniref:DUF5133 domain-containing protein n=1 Tax=unclassified Streptomyces TaxID=2593676 RepID=UPI0033A8A089|nr:DUF5133 domain-containing protein [Streptomyces sp. NBC_01176]